MLVEIGFTGMGMGGGAFRRVCIARTALLKTRCGQGSVAGLGGVEVDIVLQCGVARNKSAVLLEITRKEGAKVPSWICSLCALIFTFTTGVV
jgi:hypothetical protein